MKCDKGNPCGTCVKYGNKYCHYADHLSLFDQYDVRPELSSVNHAKGEGDNSAFGLSTNGPSGDSKSELERELELLKEKIKSIEESVTSISGEVPSSLVNGGSVRSGSSLNFLDLATVTHNSNSIHGIGGGNGNSNGGGSGSGSGSGNSGSYTSPTMVSGAAATISGSTGTGTGSVNASPVASPVVTPKNKFSTLLGRNPVASNYDTINFYAGYTPIQDKEPLRRANFGPLSWVALLRKDQGLSLLWDYIQTRRSVMELKMKVFGDEAATTKSENHFQEILKESFGFNDVRLYKNPGVDIDGKPQSVEEIFLVWPAP